MLRHDARRGSLPAQKLEAWLAAKGVSRLRLFGSCARDEDRPDSDIDLVADFTGQPSLIEIMGIERELAARLGAPVDLATTLAAAIKASKPV